MMNYPIASIESALEIAHIEQVLPDWNMRRRRFDLAADLATLGLRPCEAPAIVIADDIGTLLGWSYVLEGSRLGARILLGQVESARSAELNAATRFLRHGAGTNLWATFTAALSRIDNDPPAIADACAGARAAFDCFREAAER